MYDNTIFIGAAIGTLVLLAIVTAIVVPRYKRQAKVDPTEARKQAQHDQLVLEAESKSIELSGRETTADVQFLIAAHNRRKILENLKAESLPTA